MLELMQQALYALAGTYDVWRHFALIPLGAVAAFGVWLWLSTTRPDY